MKTIEIYTSLKKKSVELMSKGFFEEYFNTLMQLAKLEKQISIENFVNEVPSYN